MNTDSYVFKGSVYAFDQWYTPYATERFPTEIDQDHNGRVFYYSETERRPQDIEPVDDGAYQQWIDAHIGNAVEINVPWQNTSLENIEAILGD